MATIIFLIALVFVMQFLTPTAQADACFANCTISSTYTEKSKYEKNLNNLLTTLTSHASSTGIYKSSKGKNPNRVYALSLCRGDMDNTGCSACVAQAQTQLFKECPSKVRAMNWYDKCMLGYSNESFTNYSPSRVVGNPKPIPCNEGQVFNAILNHTMIDLIPQVVSSPMKYGTKMAVVSDSDKVYTLEQCIPDLKASECARCLKIAISQLPIMYGARVLLPSCYVEFEFNQFYGNGVN